MLETGLKGQRAAWRLEPEIPPEVREGLDGLSVMIAHLLYCRGYHTAEDIQEFFTLGRVSHDPYMLPDMAAAVRRIQRALETHEQVAIYGDFDCDGITSAAILVETLRGYGLDPIPYIPERSDGHGLHLEGLAWLADREVSLIITADCGIAAVDEVRVAQGMGMEIIVTDHHEPRADGSLPDCLVIAPTRFDSEYPWRFLCGVGVSYKLTQALSSAVPGGPDLDALLDLVALGTVADVVSLRDENRSLVVQGLKRLQGTSRPGLLALFRAAGVQQDRIDPVSIGFYLAPRINAANRLTTPRTAYDLITATDPAVADSLAAQLNTLNLQRQLLVEQHLAEILEELGDPAALLDEVRRGARPPLLIVLGNWPAGISGLLASKLVDAYGLPAFVGTESEEGIVAVSARSVPGVHIDELLERCEAAVPGGLFLGYGGHAGAGGFRVPNDTLTTARQLLEEGACKQVRIDEAGSVLTIDAEVLLRSLTMAAAEQVRALAPFGVGFPEPLFLARNVVLTRLSPVGGGRHLRFRLQQGMAQVDGVSFKADEDLFKVAPGTRLDVVFHFQISEWQGRRKAEMRLRDWRLAEP